MRITAFRNQDLVLLGIALLLVAVGILLIYSATYEAEAGHVYKKQILWAFVGLIAMAGTIVLPTKVFYAFAYTLFGLAVVFLLVVLILPAAEGARRWIVLGPVRIQPSELVKVATVLALARYLSHKNVNLERIRYLVLPFIFVLVPLMLVAREPDLGTSMTFAAVLFPMLYWAGLKPQHLFFIFSPLASGICSFSWLLWTFFGLALLGGIAVYRPRVWAIILLIGINVCVGISTPKLWDQLRPYQRQRIQSFLNPDKDPLGAGYQVIQSKVAIGSGGLRGKGFLRGTQTNPRFGFLPVQHTDFIFSVAGEELGFLGSMVILALYFMLIWRTLKVATLVQNSFGSLTAVGLGSILLFHIFVNVGMTIGLMPVTGIPLPFLSYGGSSLLANMILVGLLLNLSARKYEYY